MAVNEWLALVLAVLVLLLLGFVAWRLSRMGW